MAEIQIRDVPEDVYRALNARAAGAGMSLGEYILKGFSAGAERPTLKEWFEGLKKLEPIVTRESSEAAVRAIRGK